MKGIDAKKKCLELNKTCETLLCKVLTESGRQPDLSLLTLSDFFSKGVTMALLKPFVIVRTSKVPLSLSNLKKGTLAQATNKEDTLVVRAFNSKHMDIIMTELTDDDDGGEVEDDNMHDSQVTMVDVDYCT